MKKSLSNGRTHEPSGYNRNVEYSSENGVYCLEEKLLCDQFCKENDANHGDGYCRIEIYRAVNYCKINVKYFEENAFRQGYVTFYLFL